MPGLGGQPQVAKKALLVMCADHGVWDEGVAISPKAVTAIQAANMTRGTTGVCVLAAQAGAKVHVIDVGIDSELPGVVNMRVARGCGNIARGPAMSREQGQELLLEVMRYTRAWRRKASLCLASASWGWPIPRRRRRSSASDRQRCAGGGRDWRQSAVGEGWQQGGGGAAGYRRQSARPE
jgi:uncharacterized membrane protein YgcG